ncbi:hypothetical protein BAUCODRAFT_124693 [Baudoinia panamericana UAMH 10762]|uniref:Uncharacterized protein n=1 Tax=Baudoinia panamericana (strain UAMH 10762) TaxID=717646 RepID=M2N4K6_BAUPA|nr:uncharacterized protein BAUCODRAFT_124693 [Baudoinia panamericana UAMH 10762]EMC93944.1 hypothetical protein BAUCODRAFT_124693 [Baudoinia panamericana UAMH 10762]
MEGQPPPRCSSRNACDPSSRHHSRFETVQIAKAAITVLGAGSEYGHHHVTRWVLPSPSKVLSILSTPYLEPET